jgi:tRNA (cmo5U34)-methyltransferase
MKQPENTTPCTASEYDSSVRMAIPFYDMFHSETIDLVKTIKPQVKCWLDTGCGTGVLVEKAISQFPETYFILADPSKEMLAEARKRLKSVPSNRISIMNCACSENLPTEFACQPDVVTAIMCHHYCTPEERRKAVKCCFDALVPGGIFITFEHIYPDSEKQLEICLKRWKRFQMSHGRSEEEVEQHLSRFNKKYFPVRVSKHIKLLTECGFETASLFWYSQMQAGFYAIK